MLYKKINSTETTVDENNKKRAYKYFRWIRGSIMKKIVNAVVIVILLVTVFIAGNYVWSKNNTPMINLAVNNDFKKHEILILSPNDSGFNAELNNYVKGNFENVNNLLKAAKPLTVVIKNNSHRNIVGISLRWEITDANGNRQSIPQSESTPGILMGGATRASVEKGGKSYSLLPSDSSRFFSIDPAVQSIVRNQSRSVNFQSAETAEYLRQISEFIPQAKNNKEKILGDSEIISVSIDGIVFDDGTLMGADQNYFFDSIRGVIQAHKDFISEMKGLNQRGENVNATFNKLDEMASKRPDYPEKFNSKSEQFDYSYKIQLYSLAQSALRKKDNLNEKDFIKNLTSSNFGNWTELHKEEL